MESDPSELVRELAQALYTKKGTNIIALDVRGVSAVTDFVLIADGNVERHVIALANEIQDLMKKQGRKAVHVDGMGTGDWIVLDFFEIVIHLFVPKMRQKYQLERLWADGEIIDVDFDVSTSAVEKR
ncbi:ribosome silencing factor [Simkania sp.]|uniref:ribosome silencing factor n=1 Tax=Simkania sp. TaxID=34094 RepID=UPI003B522641